jgi:hypothetical protein
MTWSVRNRLALIAALLFLGSAAGCGDNTPKGTGQGGSGGNAEGGAGAGGAAGKDAGLDGDASTVDGDAHARDADANQSDADAHVSDADANQVDGDAHDATEAGGDTGDSHPDSGETGGTDVRVDGGGGTGGGGTGGGGAGGGGTGGGGAGGNPDAGIDTSPEAPTACYSVTFTKPVDQGQLSAADDKSGDQCVDGFQYDVVINTTAPDGTSVVLFAGSSMLGTVQAAAGKATFTGVQLPSSGTTILSIQFPSTAPCTAASTTSRVTVDCSVPTCSVSKPIISGTHPFLNGVSTLLGGDRASGNGSPYEVAFEVTTNIADNQTVALDVDNATTPATISTVTAHAAGGKATFLGVPLAGDGTYQVQARCIDVNGVVGRSAKGTYPVDTLPPDLTVSKPSSGSFIGPAGIMSGAFQVCGSTTASDAVGLDAGLGARQANFCVATSGSPQCVRATTVGVDTCVAVPCPGDAPFGITVTISDAAGNPQTTVLSGVTCSSATPTVQIISPLTDAPTFTDPARHLLAANAPQPFRDQNGGAAGAQTDVTACSSRAGTASLFAGLHGVALTQVGGSVATAVAGSGDGCPSGLGFVAKFVGVTLPESVEAANGSLMTATQLRVDVTDVSASTGSSAPLDLWVDSIAPTLALSSPANFCGSFHQAFATFDTDIAFSTDAPKVTLTIQNGNSTDTLASPTFSAGTATFAGVSFDVGQNNVAAVASDPAGNSTALQPALCSVTVGMAPVVFFTSPTSSNELCATTGLAAICIDDANGTMGGWQGSLTVHASVNGLPLTTGNITFSTGNTQLGVAALNGSGNATLNNVTLFDGSVPLTAQSDNIAGNGVGIAQETVVVDLGAPDAPTMFTAAVLDRRQTSFQLSWRAPADQGGPVAGYQVRYAKVQITAGNFDNLSVVTNVPFTGSPSPVGNPDGLAVQGLYIENGYFFAIAAVDAAGNRSPITATGAAVTAHFNVTTIPSPSGTNELFGHSLSSEGDLNGDGLSDIAVGTLAAGKAYLFLGSSSFGATAAPSVVFSGASTGFGFSVAQIGDIDNDGLPDLAISDSQNAQTIYIYKGRLNWPLTLTDTQANYTISTDASYASTFFGFSITRLGDFTGDGIDDFATGVRSYANSVGRVVIIPGKATGFASISLPDAANSIIIDGDATIGRPIFGYKVLGLGHFYSLSGGTTLIAAGLGVVTSTPANTGNVYAFHGQTGTAGVIPISSADNIISGPAIGARIGTGLTNLGTMFNGFHGVGIGNTLDTIDIPGGHGGAYLTSGTPAAGPFQNKQIAYLNNVGLSGGVLIGGGLPGTDVSVSLIGDATPDLVLAGQLNSPTLTISDGAKIGPRTSPNEVGSTAEVVLTLPSGWATSDGASIIADVNGDGVPDFSLGAATQPGAVLVFW